MALYKEIMSVPGLTGSWQERNRQLYYKLGAPLGSYKGNYDQNIWLLNKIRNNDYYKSGLPGSTQTSTQKTTTPQEDLLTSVTDKITPSKSFADVVDQNTWNGIFDEWTRNFANTYMLPEWQRNTYNPLMRENTQTLENLNNQIALGQTGRGSGAANKTLDLAAREALKSEEDTRQGYQSDLATLRQNVQNSWATPLYESQMSDYMNTPWRNLNLGTTTDNANIDTSGINATLSQLSGSNLDLNSIISGLNLGDLSNTTGQTYDWTAPTSDTSNLLQYLQGSNRLGSGSNLLAEYTPYL